MLLEVRVSLEPTVSIVIPTYNRATTIGRAIDSALAQTYRGFEIIVIDDGSTDETEQVLRRRHGPPGSVRYIRLPHQNAATARNRGIRESRGTYIAFLDSDDEWLPEKLAKQVAILEHAPAMTGLVYCDMVRVDPSGRVRDFPAPELRPGETFNRRSQDYQWRGIGIQSTLIRRECFDGDRYFDEAFFALCDLDLFVRLASAYDFLHLGEPLVRYHAGPGISTDMAAMAAARERMLAKYESLFTGRSDALAYQYAKICAARLLNGDTQSARETAIRALELDPTNPKVLVRALAGVAGAAIPTGVYRRLAAILPTALE
jgi:glycosyltransferase involved in cell wall biosynthesis